MAQFATSRHSIVNNNKRMNTFSVWAVRSSYILQEDLFLSLHIAFRGSVHQVSTQNSVKIICTINLPFFWNPSFKLVALLSTTITLILKQNLCDNKQNIGHDDGTG